MLKLKKLLAKILAMLKGDSQWTTVTGKTINRLAYWKKGGIVFVSIYDNGSATFTANSWNIVGTLPVEVRPATGTGSVYSSSASRTGTAKAEIQIDTAGKVNVYPTATKMFISATVAFPLMGGGCLKALFSRLSAVTLLKGGGRYVSC